MFARLIVLFLVVNVALGAKEKELKFSQQNRDSLLKLCDFRGECKMRTGGSTFTKKYFWCYQRGGQLGDYYYVNFENLFSSSGAPRLKINLENCDGDCLESCECPAHTKDGPDADGRIYEAIPVGQIGTFYTINSSCTGKIECKAVPKEFKAVPTVIYEAACRHGDDCSGNRVTTVDDEPYSKKQFRIQHTTFCVSAVARRKGDRLERVQCRHATDTPVGTLMKRPSGYWAPTSKMEINRNLKLEVDDNVCIALGGDGKTLKTLSCDGNTDTLTIMEECNLEDRSWGRCVEVQDPRILKTAFAAGAVMYLIMDCIIICCCTRICKSLEPVKKKKANKGWKKAVEEVVPKNAFKRKPTKPAHDATKKSFIYVDSSDDELVIFYF